MTIAILCSGQGGQHRAMFDLVAALPEAQSIFSAATEALEGVDPRQLVQRASEEEIQSNRIAQVLCCTQALTTWAALETHVHRMWLKNIVIAGYSIGELAAWGCAGLLDAPRVMRLAAFRAAAMNRAAGSGTALAAVRGVSRTTLATLCESYGVEIAIINAVDSYVVGGQLEAVRSLCEEALKIGAQRAVFLPVRIAAHTPRLINASVAFRAELTAAPSVLSAPAYPRLLNSTDGNRVSDIHAGLDGLAAQISRPINWEACLTACREAGAMTVLELGPGVALTNMARQALPMARCRSVDEFRSLAGVSDWLEAAFRADG